MWDTLFKFRAFFQVWRTVQSMAHFSMRLEKVVETPSLILVKNVSNSAPSIFSCFEQLYLLTIAHFIVYFQNNGLDSGIFYFVSFYIELLYF